jgi:hypothetical protein
VIGGLQPGAVYHFRLSASDGEGTASGADLTFTTFPTVGGESFSSVGSSGATLHAQVNPGGEPTSYFFEYGSTTAYGSTTPVQSVGAASEAVSVLAGVEGLQADTTYHFRVVATSARGTTSGPDEAFSTFPVATLGLPDGRGYELVSPLDNGDASVTSGGRAAADGGAVSYLGQGPPVGGNGNNANPNGRGLAIGSDNEYLVTRSTGGGWAASDIQPESLDSVHYQNFSSDLSLGILSSKEPLVAGAPSFPNESEGAALYSRDNGDGSYDLLGANASYAGSNPAGSHFLVSHDGKLEETEPATGQSYLVNVLPGGGSSGGAVFGAPARHENGGNGDVSSALFLADYSNVISDDGSRVFWTETDGEGNPQRLFVSENVGSADGRTVQLDASQNPGHMGGGGRFATASSDGSRVFFTDCQQLTTDATAIPTLGCEQEVKRKVTGGSSLRSNTPSGADLYEYDLPTGTLTDLSVAQGVEHAGVVGVLGASETGSYVYFAAAGALASGASSQECIQTVTAEEPNFATKCNVYVVHDGGAPALVTTVTSQEWADWATVVGEHQAYVAPEGGQLVFDSKQNLTGFESHGVNEIYMYTPGVGLSCVSCNPSGALTPPDTGARLSESDNTTYALRDITADGDRVFFDSSEGLVPQDENGLQDVYEWERDGSGSCTRTKGCLYDLSGGLSSDNATFGDASEDGSDVFFTSREDLVPQDEGEILQLWDAHECTSAAPCPQETSTACTGTGCQGVPGAPPVFETPSSITFHGRGNFPAAVKVVKKTAAQLKAEKLSKALKACHADKRAKKRKACEVAARRRYGASKKAVKKKG